MTDFTNALSHSATSTDAPAAGLRALMTRLRVRLAALHAPAAPPTRKDPQEAAQELYMLMISPRQ